MIITKSLTCSACGGMSFTRLSGNDYRCDHCGAVTLVEDDVAQRLEQMLAGLHRRAEAKGLGRGVRYTTLGIAAVVVLVAAIFAIVALREPSATMPAARHVDPADLQVARVVETTSPVGVRQVLVRLINRSAWPVGAFRTLTMVQHDRDSGALLAQAADPESAPWVVAPQGSGYFLFDAPKANVRYDFVVTPEVRSYDPAGQSGVSTGDVRLIPDPRTGYGKLTGLARNDDSVVAKQVSISAVLYDDRKEVAGLCGGGLATDDLPPTETARFEIGCKLIGSGSVTAWEVVATGTRDVAAPAR